MRLALSPRAYRRVTLAALLALVFIIVTGGAVRLTGSGLGCPTWPSCEEGSLVPVDATSAHAMIEFVNRTITGLVSIAVMLAVLGSLIRRPRRRDLTVLSLGLVAGVLGQIVLGGLTVLFELAPPFVMGHFILSMVLVWNAVVLHHRAAQPDGAPRPLVARRELALARAAAVVAAVVVVTGTVVTGSGPHGGDEDVERLGFDIGAVARIHGATVVLLLGLVVLALWRLSRAGAPERVQRSGSVLVAVLLSQAAVGYTQYFTGVPEVLVGIHIAGAAAVWAAVLWWNLSLFERPGPGDRAVAPGAGAGRVPVPA